MAKKKYHLFKGADLKILDHLDIDGHKINLENEHAIIEDKGLADEIDARYGIHGQEIPKAIAVGMNELHPDPIHRRTFAVPDMSRFKKEN